MTWEQTTADRNRLPSGTNTLPPGMHPAMLPSEPEAEPPRRGEGLLVATAAVIGAFLVLAGLVGYQRWRTGGDEVAEVTTEADGTDQEEERTTTTDSSEDVESSESGTTEPDVDETPDTDPDTDEPEADDIEPDTADQQGSVDVVECPSQYDQVICDAAAFVQQERGRPFKEFPNIELLDDEAFDEALLDDFAEYERELVDFERVLKALGLMDLDQNLPDVFRDLLESGVVGFYDPEIKRLVVRGGEFDLYGQLVLVHELVHAFDDQWFDLNRPDYADDDRDYGFSAVVEGNASRIEDRWRAALSPEDQERLTAQEFSALSIEDLNRLRALPPVILQLQASPYIDGQVYVDGLEAQGGEDAVDQRFVDPPDSSEEVLHPEAPADSIVIVDVETPTADGPIFSQDVLGELLISYWLGGDAAAGWGGDRYVVWQGDGEVCLTVDIAADTPTDLLELETAAAHWQAELADRRTVSTLATADRTLVRVGGCY